ncbi:MAG: ThuA domain-containing protein [Bacteroidota bacterium]|nr:ThuA domain-containing protein [Bacteroidota bacterium]
MKKYYLLYSVVLMWTLTSCNEKHEGGTGEENTLNILLFSKTGAYRHSSIEPGGQALQEYFAKHNIDAVQSEDSSVFNGNNLLPYDVVIFFNTTGNILDSLQQISLMKHVRSGKGFVGIHSAADTEYDWPWFAGLIGVQFSDHPEIQKATFVKFDTSHASVNFLPDRWMREDEEYNYRALPDSVHVVLGVDETTYKGGAHGDYHPISWYREYDGGRSFYTSMGHTVENYQDTLFLRHIMEAVKWAGKK